jgi:hypothetical protein
MAKQNGPGTTNPNDLRTAEELHETAIHESGHAVIACVLGVRCGGISIELHQKTSGQIEIPDSWEIAVHWETIGKFHCIDDRAHDAALRALIRIYQAGREAEEECLGHCRGGDRYDQAQIERILGAPVGSAIENRHRRATRQLVRSYRKEIENLATVLLEHKKISSEEIRSAAGLPPAAEPQTEDERLAQTRELFLKKQQLGRRLANPLTMRGGLIMPTKIIQIGPMECLVGELPSAIPKGGWCTTTVARRGGSVCTGSARGWSQPGRCRSGSFAAADGRLSLGRIIGRKHRARTHPKAPPERGIAPAVPGNRWTGRSRPAGGTRFSLARCLLGARQQAI